MLIPLETTIMFDDRDATGYRFDYRDMRSPLLTFDPGVDDPTAFQLSELRDRPGSQTNKFRMGSLDLEWQVADGFELESGPFYRRFNYATTNQRRDTTYCAIFTCAPGQYGAFVTPDLAEIFTLGEADQPAGNSNTWAIPDLEAAADFIELYDLPAVQDLGGTRSSGRGIKPGAVKACSVGLPSAEVQVVAVGVVAVLDGAGERPPLRPDSGLPALRSTTSGDRD